MLDLVVDKRLRRKLTTVVDSIALEPNAAARTSPRAATHGVPCTRCCSHAGRGVVPRPQPRRVRVPVPAKVLTSQLRAAAALPRPRRRRLRRGARRRTRWLVPPPFVTAPGPPAGRRSSPCRCEFGLQISRFTWPGGAEEIGARLASIAPRRRGGRLHEHLGDGPLPPDPGRRSGVGRHARQLHDARLPRRRRPSACALGVLVTGITYRNVAHLAKIVATLDVLSGGRAMCGLGAAWFEREHELYGWDFPPVRSATSCSRTRSSCCR